LGGEIKKSGVVLHVAQRSASKNTY